MNDRWLFRMERQMQLELPVDGLQLLIRAFPLDLPVAIPNAGTGCAHAGDAGASAIASFRVIELLAIQIAQCQMGEVDILHVPGGGFCGTAADRLAEKSQFESVVTAVCGFQIPREVPPFRLKAGMIEKISGEFESIAGHRGLVLRRKRVEKQERRC